MKTILKLALGTASFLIAMGAQAGGGALLGGVGASNMAQGTMYGGASFGKADPLCAKTEEDCENDGWKVYGGYKFSDMFGIEGGYYNLGEQDKIGVAFDDPKLGAGTANASIKSSGLAVSGLASVQVMDNLEAFGKLGLMHWSAEAELTNIRRENGQTIPSYSDEISGTDLLYGVGAGYKFNENWGIRGELERLNGDNESNIYSVGATFSSL